MHTRTLHAQALAAALVLLTAVAATAQDDPAPVEPTPDEQTAQEGVTEPAPLDPEAVAAAEALMEAMDLEALTRATTESMLENMFAQNPMLADYREVFLDFFDEYLKWEAVKDDYVRVYAEVYTPAELRELTAFYGTPLGRRLLETTPVVSARGAQIGEAAIQPHLPELQRRLSEAMEASTGSIEQ